MSDFFSLPLTDFDSEMSSKSSKAPETSSPSAEGGKKPSLGKIRLDTSCLQGGGGGGGCPAEKLLYVLFAIIGKYLIIDIQKLQIVISGILYAVHLADKDNFSKYSTKFNVGFLSDIFVFIDNYSPFNEVLETDEELLAKLKAQKVKPSEKEATGTTKDGIKVFSEEELKKYTGGPDSPGLYIALLGVVYDVSKGEPIGILCEDVYE